MKLVEIDESIVLELKPVYKGSAGSRAIQALNPGIVDVNKIFVGQKITLPGGKQYTVAAGDTLDAIASGKFKGMAASPTSTPSMPDAGKPKDDLKWMDKVSPMQQAAVAYPGIEKTNKIEVEPRSNIPTVNVGKPTDQDSNIPNVKMTAVPPAENPSGNTTITPAAKTLEPETGTDMYGNPYTVHVGKIPEDNDVETIKELLKRLK